MKRLFLALIALTVGLAVFSTPVLAQDAQAPKTSDEVCQELTEQIVFHDKEAFLLTAEIKALENEIKDTEMAMDDAERRYKVGKDEHNSIDSEKGVAAGDYFFFHNKIYELRDQIAKLEAKREAAERMRDLLKDALKLLQPE